MITLVTGSPGAGKTLWTVKEIVDKLIPTGRPIYTNIAGFNHEASNVHICGDEMPFSWQEVDDDAIFIFDEVQRQYPPRHATAKVPEYISAYQTHRHRGFDFYFVTQGPKLIDRHLWDLTERHIHLFRSFGLKRSRILEWGSVNESPQPPQSNLTAMKKGFSFPRKYFQYYKSASVHTDQPKLPVHVFAMMGGLALLCVGAFAYAFHQLGNFGGEHSQPPHKAGNAALNPCGGRILGVVGSDVFFASQGSIVSLKVHDTHKKLLTDLQGNVCSYAVQVQTQAKDTANGLPNQS